MIRQAAGSARARGNWEALVEMQVCCVQAAYSPMRIW